MSAFRIEDAGVLAPIQAVATRTAVHSNHGNGGATEPPAGPLVSDMVRISPAAKVAQAEHPESAAHEAAESPTETAKEAANGDLQALAILAKQTAAKKAYQTH